MQNTGDIYNSTSHQTGRRLRTGADRQYPPLVIGTDRQNGTAYHCEAYSTIRPIVSLRSEIGLDPESSSVLRSPSSSSSVLSSAPCAISRPTLALDMKFGRRLRSKSCAWAEATIVPTRLIPTEGRRWRARMLDIEGVPCSTSPGDMKGVEACCWSWSWTSSAEPSIGGAAGDGTS